MSYESLGFVCNPYHRGGITRWMADLAAEWARAHGSVYFVTARPRRPFVSAGGRPTMSDLISETDDSRIIVEAPEVGSTFEFGMEAHRAAVYARAIQRSIPEGTALVVSDDPAAWRAAAAVGAQYPLVGVLHSDEQHYYRLAARFNKEAAALVSVSRRIAAKAQLIGSNSSIVRAVVPCGTPLSEDEHDGGVAEDALRLLWVGRLDEHQKRISDLPAIVAQVAELGLRCRLRIAGAGGDEGLLRKAVSHFNVGASVELLGWKSATELRQLRSESDILLLPSNFEGMPVAVMEALAAGCAVVASRVSGVEDYMDHPSAPWCYWVHEVGDTKQAGECIRAAAAVPTAERAAHARAMARDAFSIERCAQRYRTLIGSLARQHGAPRHELPQIMSAVLSLPLAASRMTRLWYRSRFGPKKRQAVPQRFAELRQL